MVSIIEFLGFCNVYPSELFLELSGDEESLLVGSLAEDVDDGLLVGAEPFHGGPQLLGVGHGRFHRVAGHFHHRRDLALLNKFIILSCRHLRYIIPPSPPT